MTFEEWWGKLHPKLWATDEEMVRLAWDEAQRQLLLDLTNARIDAQDQMVLAEMQRVKNFKALA